MSTHSRRRRLEGLSPLQLPTSAGGHGEAEDGGVAPEAAAGADPEQTAAAAPPPPPRRVRVSACWPGRRTGTRGHGPGQSRRD